MGSAGRRIGGVVAAAVVLAAPAALAGWTQSSAMTPPVATNTNPGGFAFGGGFAAVAYEAAAPARCTSCSGIRARAGPTAAR
jgi:peptidoglycan/LPS O-acetylase OafA/YrhL